MNPYLIAVAVLGLLLAVGPQLMTVAKFALAHRPSGAVASRVAGAVLCVVCLALALRPNVPAPSPGPSPVVPTPPSVVLPAETVAVLNSGFAGRASEAGVWAGLLNGLAFAIEADGRRPTPRLTTMIDVQRLRDHIVATVPKPVAGGSEVGQAIGPSFAAIGTGPEPLDAQRRADLVKVLQGVSSHLENLSR